MSVIDDAAAATLHKFRVNTVEPGSAVVTDGWAAYPKACRDWFVHEPHPVSGSGHDAHELLPAVHRVASLCKRWLLGTHQGGVLPAHTQSYLEEFCFRFNRRHSRARGLLFYRLLQYAAGAPPLPAAGGQPPPESDQTARPDRAAIPAQQPRPATPRPALAVRQEPRLRPRRDGSEMDSPPPEKDWWRRS